MSRLDDLQRFYRILDLLRDRRGGLQSITQLGSQQLPQRGVYFFFEPNEVRRDSGVGLRVVRVGTHALTVGSRSTLRQRLMQHRGVSAGGGNHRGSIFRLLVGEAMLNQGGLDACPSWGVKGDISKAAIQLDCTREQLAALEAPVERAVSRHIASMSVLWLDIPDEPSRSSLRDHVERNSIALLSNYDRDPLDVVSPDWLGRSSKRLLVRNSGLWNQRHVKETHDPTFPDVLERLVVQTGEER